MARPACLGYSLGTAQVGGDLDSDKRLSLSSNRRLFSSTTWSRFSDAQSRSDKFANTWPFLGSNKAMPLIDPNKNPVGLDVRLKNETNPAYRRMLEEVRFHVAVEAAL